ncbi:ABC transporter permease [Luteitalea pratensis]|uniref:ABC transporter permease n=1 Tax=Luteitalea pratensis TaxID=1855912 RepID=UPI00214F63A9|nr:ABC transporter permease [Luteitalea pratensis]
MARATPAPIHAWRRHGAHPGPDGQREFFGTLGIVPAAGRLIARGDDQRGCPPVAVLSDGFWGRQFARSPAAVGDRLLIGQDVFAVIGVGPRTFTGVNVGTRFDVAIPLCASARLDRRNVESAGRQWLDLAGRLARDDRGAGQRTPGRVVARDHARFHGR